MNDTEKFFLSKVFDGSLSVSEQGLVLNNITGRLIGATGTGRYPKISMSENGRAGPIRHIQIHRLVWLIYKGEIPTGFELNHKDGNKENRCLNNLELVSPKQNMEHAVINGLHKGKKAEENPQAKFSNQEVEMYRKRFHSGLLNIKSIVIEKSISSQSVSSMLKGVTYASVGGPITRISTQKQTKLSCKYMSFQEAKEKFGISKNLWIKYNSKK
jgi:hypothetical protein